MMAAAIFTGCNGGKASQKAEIKLPDGVAQYEMDGFTVTWIRDNAQPRMNQVSLFSNVPEEVAQEFAGGIPSSMSAVVIQQNGKIALFDTGMGSANSMLLPSLDSLGIAPEDVDYLCITHLHGDHIGGMSKNGAPVFPNAQLYIGKVEYDAWMAMDEARSAQPKAMIEPYGDKLNLFEYNEKLPMGIVGLDSHGHTPGHVSFVKDNVMVAGDIMHGVALQIEHPECNASFDMDPEAAVASRKAMLSLAKEKKMLVCGMHFPEGGAIDLR